VDAVLGEPVSRPVEGDARDDRIAIELPVGDGVDATTATVRCSALAPGTPVRLDLQPSGVVLARGTVDERGSCLLTAALPAEGAGQLVLTGVAPDGTQVLGSVTFRLPGRSATAELPRTGSTPARLLLLGLALCGSGFLLQRRGRRAPHGPR